MNAINLTQWNIQSLSGLTVICTTAGQWGKPTCSHTVLSEFVGTIHTSRPFCNATSLTVGLYEQQQHIICWFTDTKWQLIKNLRDNNPCSQMADIHYRENLNLIQCTTVVFCPVLHGAPIRPTSQSIKPIQSILQTPISILSSPLPVCTNIITTNSKVFSLAWAMFVGTAKMA
jgi:hypothetical protein